MTIFVDTAYWVARLDKRDQLHERAREVMSQLSTVSLLTTELVLVEVLNYFSGYRADVRQAVVSTVQFLLVESDIELVWQTQELFMAGMDLYRARLDRGYSLTDCVSMMVMQQQGLTDALTNDRHFVQEGFTILL